MGRALGIGLEVTIPPDPEPHRDPKRVVFSVINTASVPVPPIVATSPTPYILDEDWRMANKKWHCRPPETFRIVSQRYIS
jgi:hypothetical protein